MLASSWMHRQISLPSIFYRIFDDDTDDIDTYSAMNAFLRRKIDIFATENALL